MLFFHFILFLDLIVHYLYNLKFMINNLFFEYFWIIKKAIPFKIAPKKIFCIVWFEMLHPYFNGYTTFTSFGENPLFINVTEFFSDIKIDIFWLIFITFYYFFSIFRNFKYAFLLVLRGFFLNIFISCSGRNFFYKLILPYFIWFFKVFF